MFGKSKSTADIAPTSFVPKKAAAANSLKLPIAKKSSNIDSTVMKTNTVTGVDATHLQAGSRVWVPDAKVLWRVGEVTAVEVDTSIVDVFVPESPDEKHQKVAPSAMLAFDPSHLVDHTDMAQMNNMHEAPLMSVLHRRYVNDSIYTFTTDILISVNPYKSIPMLYDIAGFMASSKAKLDCELKTPHLFSIAEKAYRDMRAIKRDGATTAQSIVVSGESGAGKTEASKHIMKYLAVASRQADDTKGAVHPPAGHVTLHEKIEECVLLSNYVLESFGNAKTSRNDNSSRFGKYIQILYDREGRMCGVAIKHFLLEKTRIVLPETNERNYHVFYQMLAGMEPREQTDLELTTAEHYEYLTTGNCIEIDGVDDAADFRVLRASMTKLGFTPATQTEIFQVLAAILKLGNASFTCQQNDRDACQFAPDVPVETIASLLGVKATELEEKMTTQTTVTGRGSILHMKLTCEQAQHAKHAFCKYIYGEVFNYLIGRMNSTASEAKAQSFIGILDIFGFEVMPANSFEQLCINFANEVLQQQFNKHIFVLEQERYAAEGISVSVIEFQDNQECLDLIQKPPSGIMPLLDEQIMLKRKTTDRQLLSIYHQTHLEKHPHYAKPRFESDDFVIKHYAGDVVYCINGFIGKNNDNLHEDLMELLRASSLELVAAMLSGHTPVGVTLKSPRATDLPTSPTTKHRRNASSLSGSTTVASKFKAQLGGLMDMLSSTTPHYIKCIKPNNIKFPGGFSSELVRDQLICSGILEVIKIRQQGYPIRRPFDHFFDTFRIILRGKAARCGSTIEGCRQIATFALLPNAFQIGKTEIYLRYGQLELLQSVLLSVKGDIATTIQSKFWRRCVAQKQYQTVRNGMLALQAKFRQVVVTERYRKLRWAATKLQATCRRNACVRVFTAQKKAAIVVHTIARGFVTRRRIIRHALMERAAVTVQKVVRGYLHRSKVARALKCQTKSAIKIQALYRGYVQLQQFCRVYENVVLLQAVYRAHQSRQTFLRGKAAAVASQALVRKLLQRKKFVHQRKMAIRLQSFARMVPCRVWHVRRQRAACAIQCMVRGALARQRFAQVVAATKLVASVVRMYHCKKALAMMRHSIACIQRSVRVYLNRRWYLNVLKAVKVVQRVVRKWRVKRCLQGQLALLRDACDRRESDVVIQLVRDTPDLIHVRHHHNNFNSLLHIAAAAGDLNVVQFILTQDANAVKLANSRGNTPLHEACAHSRLDIAKVLLRAASSIKLQAPETNPASDEAPGEELKTERTSHADVTVLAGTLRKRREASSWMTRYVVLKTCNQVPELHYYHSKHHVGGKSDKALDLRRALFKKSDDVAYSFEIHSPELLQGRNREGRLYFQAASEMELQTWLASLRDTVPSSLETRLFAMQRAPNSIQYVDRANQAEWVNAPNARGETMLHLAAHATNDNVGTANRDKAAREFTKTDEPAPAASDTSAIKADEVHAIKTCLWLLEHGADLNAQTRSKQTPLKLAIQRKFHALAKHLLDRGATAAELTPTETTIVQALKLELAKSAITNVQCQTKDDPAAVLFLLKQPGHLRNSSYVSLYVDQVGLVHAAEYTRPRLVISVFDTEKNLVEKKQQVTSLPLAQSNAMFWGCTWHMQTPMENLPAGALVVIEIVSSTHHGHLMPSSPQYGAVHPVCWTFLHIDKRTATTSAFTSEMYVYPMDLKLKKLQRYDGFISGDIVLSQGTMS